METSCLGAPWKKPTCPLRVSNRISQRLPRSQRALIHQTIPDVLIGLLMESGNLLRISAALRTNRPSLFPDSFPFFEELDTESPSGATPVDFENHQFLDSIRAGAKGPVLRSLRS